MLRLATTRRDGVDVEIERQQRCGGGIRPSIASERNRNDAGQARLLECFPTGHAQGIGIAVGMTTELEPAAQPDVVRQQGAAAVGRDDPGRAGDMAGHTTALEAVGTGLHKGAEPRYRRGRIGNSARVTVEQIEEEPAMHAPSLTPRSRRCQRRGGGHRRSAGVRREWARRPSATGGARERAWPVAGPLHERLRGLTSTGGRGRRASTARHRHAVATARGCRPRPLTTAG